MLVTLLVLCSGCGFRPATEIAISPDFDPEEQEAILAAIDDWKAAVPEFKDLPVYIGRGDNGSILTAQESHKEKAPCDSWADTHLTLTKAPRIRICDPSATPSKLTYYVRHELGHALAARDDHLTSEAVMSGKVAGEMLTPEDVAYVHQ